MIIVAISLIMLGTLSLFLFGCYILNRCYKVLEFRSKVLDLCSEHNMIFLSRVQTCYELSLYENAIITIYSEMPSYYRMLFSFKPLTLENWIPKNKLQKLFKYL